MTVGQVVDNASDSAKDIPTSGSGVRRVRVMIAIPGPRMRSTILHFLEDEDYLNRHRNPHVSACFSVKTLLLRPSRCQRMLRIPVGILK